jgi:hypothetical protein
MVECICSGDEHGHPAYECHNLTTANARLCPGCAEQQKIETDRKPPKPIFDDLSC